MPLTALVLSCTLKKSPAESSSVLIGQQFLDTLRNHDVTGELVRVVDHDIRFGVSTDEGDGDGWRVEGQSAGRRQQGGARQGQGNAAPPDG